MRRRLLAAAVVLVPATMAATAVPALAATPTRTGAVVVKYVGATAPIHAVASSSLSCAGTPVWHKQALVAGKPVAELDVYTSTSNGGTVYACMRHLGITRGLRLPTAVDVAGAPTATSKNGVIVLAAGNYVSYAGPAAVGGLHGKYVAAAGTIVIAGKKIVITMTPTKVA